VLGMLEERVARRVGRRDARCDLGRRERLVGDVVVEVLGRCRVGELRDERRRLEVQGRKVDAAEPGMAEQLVDAVVGGTGWVCDAGEEARALLDDDRVGALAAGARRARAEALLGLADEAREEVDGLARDARLGGEAQRLAPREDLRVGGNLSASLLAAARARLVGATANGPRYREGRRRRRRGSGRAPYCASPDETC